MTKVACIGRCKGCDRARQLDDGVCEDCLTPPRGRAWAERAHRCRTNPAFAKEVYESIQSLSGKKMFIGMFGVPSGSLPPEEHPVPTGTNPVPVSVCPVPTGSLRLVKS